MSLWEYKIITSGKGGFASPALLEKFLNDLGREEWEIIEFHTQADNFLVFTGLARRTTQRDWTLEGAAAAAAKAEADKLRAEFEAKFKAATGNGPAADEAAQFLEEKVAPEDGFRKPIDTSHDADADEEDEKDEKDEDDWDKLTAAEEDELPTFFDAIKPHMRRNQRGPGMSVGVDYLAKKWDQSEDDLMAALGECGFTIPEDEDAKPEYLEFEGDLYWININRRGELWINTKEKPRPVFRAVKAQKAHVEEEQKPEPRKHHEKVEQPKPAAAEPPESQPRAEVAAAPAQPETPAEPGELPSGPALLEKIRPLMRRNRRGPGGSGSASFLSRALKVREADLVAGFKALGLVVPSSANEKPTNVDIANGIWWINVDSRGNVWINGRDKKPGETLEAAAPTIETPAGETAVEAAQPSGGAAVPLEAAPGSAGPEAVPAPEVAPAATVEASMPLAPAESTESGSAPAAREGDTGAQPAPSSPAANVPAANLAEIRALLKETRTGAFAAKLERLAEKIERPQDELVAALVAAGLAVPEKPREKPVFVEHAGEIFWLNRNARNELWLNAKPSKFADKKGGDEEATDGETGSADTQGGGEKRPRRPRGRKKAE